MMEKKKRKNIFMVLFTVMITVMSLIAVSLYDNAKTQGVKMCIRDSHFRECADTGYYTAEK